MNLRDNHIADASIYFAIYDIRTTICSVEANDDIQRVEYEEDC
jgi:hypothetical protein